MPLLVCRDTSIADDLASVRIEWETIHTGGLELDSISIEYAALSGNGTTSENFTVVYDATFDTDGVANLVTLPLAGLNYTFRVSAENSEGESVPSVCPPIFLLIGEWSLIHIITRLPCCSASKAA